jgi:hypothetical protein
MTGRTYSHELRPDYRRQASLASERDRLALDLENRLRRLNDQARIFLPLIAFWLIVSIPVWSKSPARFVLLLLNPFVLLPIGFCVAHLVMALRGIAKARSRIREWEHITSELNEFD